MQRIVEQEWLDYDLGTPAEIAASLRSLRQVNKLFGGNRLHTRLLQRALADVQTELPHVVEVACGHADVLQAALLALRRPVQVTLLDRSARHLPDAADWSSALQQPQHVVGDALDLPLADASADVVSCCLFLHHLEPPQIARFLAEALRVARVGVMINDLERTSVHSMLSRVFRCVDRSRLSRHDGPVSVRAAYTCDELQRMLASTGHRFLVERHYLYRLGAIVWKH